MGLVGARHGQGVFFVFQAVVGFVFDGGFCGLLLQAGLEAATLDHEALDDAVEDGAVVVAFAGVSQKIGGAQGGLLIVKFDADDAVIGMDLRGFAHVVVSCLERGGHVAGVTFECWLFE